ncbi:Anaphase-promoting complex subunit 4 [Liparis tanakae]|uniref:Anaphase-promoting complex subunit 4 n=1 Tax=Liparis tanakae TaxID=230148 RepID=A0A4Z2FAU5_9TELE|nr:Anaphase-promoting complex subunit 4 [Liparis tanakae]
MPAFRQVGEKQLPNPVLCMAWSPKRDLIALANTTGELLLHRLASFQRVWSLPPSEYTGKEITALAWRPDGKILAFSLGDTKQVVLCGVEKAEILHVFPMQHPVTCMHWMEVTEESSEEKSDEIMNLMGEVRLNVLVLGGDSGFVELFAYGMYKIATLSGLDTRLLSDCLPEVTRMARKFTHISTLLQYLHLSLTCMCEAWEDILMQMDLRLTKFVQGLKKLGHSIESSYSSIQKLVISHLQSGSEALLYHLSEVKGMSLWKQKFEPLGLDAVAIEGAITAVGSFSLKANELLQVIDKSTKNFKAFFRWLYVAMLRMCEEHVPPELNKMTQKDIAFVADFLSEHFSENEELFDRKGKYFNVERVGQYLKDEDEDLVSPPNTKGNQWLKFLQESAHLKESPLLFPSFPQKSLHFVKRMMEGVIEECLQKPAEVIGKSVTQAVFLPLYTVPERWNDKKSKMHHVVFCIPESSPGKLYLLRRGTDPHRLVPNGVLSIDLRHQVDGEAAARPSCLYSCLDARFYDDEMLTVVLRGDGEREESVLAQLPLASALSCQAEFQLEPNLRLDQQSGAIPCQELLSANLRHIRVFEMDVEDEDDEGAESQNASADQDGLDATMASEGRGEEPKEDSGERGGDAFRKTEEQLESEEAL